MLPKVIVTSGCSYGKFHTAFEAWKNPDIVNTDLYQNLEFVIDLHSMSLGSRFQSISIIETVDKLITSGANPNDIFVICEFSEIDRSDIVIQNDFLVECIDNAVHTEIVNGTEHKFEPIEYPTFLTIKHSEYTKKIIPNLKVKKFFAGDYAKFNNYYIIFPEKGCQPTFPNSAIQSVLDSYVDHMNIDIKITDNYKEAVDKINIEHTNRAINYFQNILTTEQYLKSKGVKYKFCLINNQFSLHDENGLQSNKLSKVVNGEHYLNQDYVNSKQIWEINSMVNILYNMIDWSNWWFYENKDKNIIWGGIDEYAIDKFGKKVFSARNSDENLFGQHPDDIVYWELTKNHIMKEYF